MFLLWDVIGLTREARADYCFSCRAFLLKPSHSIEAPFAKLENPSSAAG